MEQTTVAGEGTETNLGQPGGALAQRDPSDGLPGPADPIAAYFNMPKEHRDAISQFLGVDADDPALPAYIAICAQHDLNPFLGQIWLIETVEKKKVVDAAGNESREKRLRKRPATGRDGFLAVAHRTGLLKGVQCDVICANDHFDVDWSVAPSEAPRVSHRHAKLTQGEGVKAEDARAYRGPIIAAWAKITRSDDTFPFFFYAPLTQHAQTWASGDGTRSGYSGAWSYTNAMILKAAMSYALRLAFSVTGVVPVDELRDGRPVLEGTAMEMGPEDLFDDVPLPADEELADRIRKAVEEANQIEANRFSAATLQMLLSDRSEEELRELVLGIETENRLARERDAALNADAERRAAESAAAEPEGEPEVVDGEATDAPEAPASEADGDESEGVADAEGEEAAAQQVANLAQRQLDSHRRDIDALNAQLADETDADRREQIEAEIRDHEEKITGLGGALE